MTTVLITGANRGLGLEFVKQCLTAGHQVIGCCRDPKSATDLKALQCPELTVYPLDISQSRSIESLKTALADQPIDILINNAGVFGERGNDFGKLDGDGYLQCLHINSAAPLILAQTLYPNIEKGTGKKLVFITSRMGSIGDNSMGSHLAYRASKAALNAAVHSLAIDLADNATLLLMHPGWVQTDMGGQAAPLKPPESVSGMLDVINSATNVMSGKFLNYAGEEIIW